MIAFSLSLLGFSHTAFAAGQGTDRKPSITCDQLGSIKLKDVANGAARSRGLHARVQASTGKLFW
jgi:hypothetical protein